MIIAVGSMNSTKLSAVQEAIYGDNVREPGYPSFQLDDIKGYNVSSGVSDQPQGLRETMWGAVNRASLAFTMGQGEGTCRFGIGIEAGLIVMPEFFDDDDGGKRYFFTNAIDGSIRHEERTYCVIHDGSRYFFGSSAGFEHPKAITDCVLREGVDISEAYRRCGFTDSPKIGTEKGCINLLTKGRVTRDQEIADAVRRALIAFENREMYGL